MKVPGLTRCTFIVELTDVRFHVTHRVMWFTSLYMIDRYIGSLLIFLGCECDWRASEVSETLSGEYN